MQQTSSQDQENNATIMKPKERALDAQIPYPLSGGKPGLNDEIRLVSGAILEVAYSHVWLKSDAGLRVFAARSQFLDAEGISEGKRVFFEIHYGSSGRVARAVRRADA